MAREALGIRRRLFGNDHLDVADSLRNLCIILGDERNWVESESLAREVLAMRRHLLGPEHPLVAWALDDVAWAANARGEFAEAEALEAQALAMRRKLLADQHPDVAKTLNALGQVLAHQGELPEAHAVLKAVLSIQRQLLSEDNPATLDSLTSLGNVLESEGKWSEAEPLWREALAVWRERGGNENPEKLYAQRGLGLTLEGEGKWSEAESLWRESLAAWRKRGGNEEQQSMYTLRKLGLALEAEGKLPEAEAVHREALEVSRNKGDEDPEALVDLERLVRVLVGEKKFGEAEQLLGQVLTPAFVRQSPSANLLVQRVDLMGRRGRWQEAAADAALALKLQPTDHYRYHTLVGLLAITHDRPAYEQLCQRILTKFANPTNPYVAERMVQDCLLLPHSGVDLGLVDKLADTAITLGSGEAALPYFQACEAMSNYRLGHMAEAIDWGERAAKGSIVDAQAKAYAVLAMAHWQLGQKDIARAMLAKGDALAPNLLPSRDDEDLGESWVAWLFARVSLDEATALIQSGSTSESSSNRP
jgi:eukaryotic-like serine/threonine-protein kinase